MEKLVTPKDGLKKSQQQYHSIQHISSDSGVDIRNFMRAFRQFADRFHGTKAPYTYSWVRHSNGHIYLALSGSRSVQYAFDSFVRAYGVFMFVWRDTFGRFEKSFNETFAEYADAKHGRHGRGGSR